MLPIVWVACAVAIITAAARSRRDSSALRFGRRAVAVLYLGAGSAVNAFFLLRGDDYAEFAAGAYVAFVRDTWRSVVVPHHDIWISLLIAFELAVGVLALLGGRCTRLAYAAAIAFHVALLSFGWGFCLWSVPMVWALSELLRGELRAADRSSVPIGWCPSRFARPEAPVGLGAGVDLYWIPLGAGGQSVRFNGIVYEAISSMIARRPRRDIFHTALIVTVPSGRFTIEMTPVPDRDGVGRGVVAEGPVGLRVAGGSRLFRYEVRCWRDGIIPDLGFAVASPIRLTDDTAVAERLIELLPSVPTLTWGRDELGVGDMWSCNSIISWALTVAGIDPDAVAFPPNARAPGWDAGVRAAHDQHHVCAAVAA
jgi:hypothetical protein